MTRSEQAQFVRDLIADVQDRILDKIRRVPEEWDGIELRQYIADAFEAQSPLPNRDPKRFAAYENEVAVRNL